MQRTRLTQDSLLHHGVLIQAGSLHDGALNGLIQADPLNYGVLIQAGWRVSFFSPYFFKRNTEYMRCVALGDSLHRT